MVIKRRSATLVHHRGQPARHLTRTPLKKTKILIVEEYQGIIQVFRRLLRNAPEIEIVWEARSIFEAQVALELCKPDIVLMTSPPSWRQAIKIWKEFKAQAPDCKLLALTPTEHAFQVGQANGMGVTFLAKEEMVRFLVPIIRTLIEPSKLEKVSSS
jgi:DNA-binding NarL/FixJ family response regulator